MSATLLVDGHVHYHPCYTVGDFLEAARRNFETTRRTVGDPDALGCLMLAESAWCHYFRAFAGGMIERSAAGWAVEPTDEPCSLIVRHDDGSGLVVVAGRQIVTADRLEVLALATVQEYPDGLPFVEAVRLSLSSGALTVLPWGFGKWSGRRGRIVREVLRSPVADEVYVGDNGGRPAVAPEPALFELVRDRGIPIVRGSDPLPIEAEVRKPGRFGFVLEGAFDPAAPAAAIRRLLATRAQPTGYGRLERLATFVHRQVALRVRRHSRDPAGGASNDGGTVP